jgi:hypothetical protein
MTFNEFDKFQEQLLKQVVEMKNTKGKEYANSESRFANFDRLSVRLNISNLAVALVYLTKHMDAIESYIARGRTYSTETIQGRIVDAITYLTLIAGMIEEKENDLKPPRYITVCSICGIFRNPENEWLLCNDKKIHMWLEKNT